MSNLVNRLRRDYKLGAALGLPTVLGVDAANEIERLDDDNARLTAELERMDGMHRAFDAKYIAWLGERDTLQAQVKGLREAGFAAVLTRSARTNCEWDSANRRRQVTRWPASALAGPTRTAEQPEDALPDGRECGACGHWIEEGASEECSLSHTTDPTTAEGSGG